MQCCSLQHWTLLLSPVTSTAGYCFCFGSIPSLFLELFLHWSLVAYWSLSDLGSSSFSILSFCLFILFMGFSRQEYWSGLPFPSPVDHIQFLTSLLFMSGSNCFFLTCIQVSQEAGKVVWYYHLFKNFPRFVVIHSQRLWCSEWSRSRCFPGIVLLFLWSSGLWQFDLWFLCLF